MKKQILLSFLLVVFISRVNAQITFERTYGGVNNDCGKSVQQTSDGGYVICGYSESFGNGQEYNYLTKTNPLVRVLRTETTKR